MKRALPLVGGMVVLLIGIGIGAAGGEDVAIEPTPTVIVVTPEPQEQPTPRVETVTEYIETEVASQTCKDALYKADAILSDNAETMLDILSAYVDYPDEDLTQFGRRVENILAAIDEGDQAWDDYVTLADECLAS